MEKYYVGTELKFALTITSAGFNMDEDSWAAHVICGRKSVTCSRNHDAVVDDQGQWYILVDSQYLGTGKYYLVVVIDVPDDDFEDGYRHEVLQQERPICIVNDTYKYSVQS